MIGINQLELKQLRILRALLRERNVSRVANQIGLTQQAVSDQLKKLRHIFDDRLFVRTSNGLIPTPEAERLGKKLDKILNDVEDLFDVPEFDPKTASGIYTISATDYAQVVVMPQLLSVIWKHAPNLKIVVRDFEIDLLSSQMMTGEVDLALTFPDFIPDSLPYLSLFKEHHVCVASDTSPLIGKKLTLTDIASTPQIIVSSSSANLRGSIDTLFEKKGLSRNVIMSAPCFSLVPRYIKTTNAIAFIPSRSLPEKGLKELDLSIKPIEFEVIAAWHTRSNNDPLHNWILSILKENTHS